MNTLLLLLMLAQPLASIKGYNFHYSEPVLYLLTAEMLFEYEDSCYADSTFTNICLGQAWLFVASSDISIVYDNDYAYRGQWTHRPFKLGQHFIEWLRRRVERERK